MSEIYARICRWAVVRLREPGRPSTRHIVGYVAYHRRLIDYTGEPYIGSSLIELDLRRRTAINRRGKVIELIGDPLPSGALPDDIQAMMHRAEWAWRVAEGAAWERDEAGSNV